MLSRGFSRMFWGLLIVLIDLRIEGLDLSFDPVGWVLVALGVAALKPLSNRARTAQALSWVMAPLSLLRYVPVPLLALAPALVAVAAIWFALDAVAQVARASETPALVDWAVRLRNLSAIGAFVLFAAEGARAMGAPLVGSVALGVSLAYLILAGFVLSLIWRMKKASASMEIVHA